MDIYNTYLNIFVSIIIVSRMVNFLSTVNMGKLNSTETNKDEVLRGKYNNTSYSLNAKIYVDYCVF